MGSYINQNIDRRPPTLLKHFTLVQYPPGTLTQLPTYLSALSNDDPASSALTLITSSPLTSYTLSPLPFFDAGEDGIRLQICSADQSGYNEEFRRNISRFVRTADGMGVASLNADGSVESWEVTDRGSNISRCQGKEKLDREMAADLVVVLEAGRSHLKVIVGVVSGHIDLD